MVFKGHKTAYKTLKSIEYLSFIAIVYFNGIGIFQLYNGKEIEQITTNLLLAVSFLIASIIVGIISSVLKSYSISKHIDYILNKQNISYSNLKLHTDDLFTYNEINPETNEVLSKKVISIYYKEGKMYFLELEKSISPAIILNKDLTLSKGCITVEPLTEKVETINLTEEQYKEMFEIEEEEIIEVKTEKTEDTSEDTIQK